MQRNDRRSLVMFVSSMLIFGTIGVFRRWIPVPSALLAMVRGLMGGLLILAFLRLRGQRTGQEAGRLPGKTAAVLAVSGIVMGFNWILLFEAYNHTTVGTATLCYYMQPTIVMLLSPVIFQERLTAKKAVCAGIAIIGMALVSGVTGGAGAGSVRGVLLGLGAAVFYSAVVIMNKTVSGVDAYQKTAIQLLSAGIVMIPYLLLTGGAVGELGGKTALLLGIVGILHTGIAYVLYFGSMDGLRVQTIALVSYADPVSALLFSALFLREPLGVPGLVGAVMIIGSALVSELRTDNG
jgi:RarD protein